MLCVIVHWYFIEFDQFSVLIVVLDLSIYLRFYIWWVFSKHVRNV